MTQSWPKKHMQIFSSTCFFLLCCQYSYNRQPKLALKYRKCADIFIYRFHSVVLSILIQQQPPKLAQNTENVQIFSSTGFIHTHTKEILFSLSLSIISLSLSRSLSLSLSLFSLSLSLSFEYDNLGAQPKLQALVFQPLP